MAQTAAHLVDHVILQVPVRQWVLSFPNPLRTLFAAHPQLLSPVLQIIHRVIATFLIKQAGRKRSEADTGAITLIQRFGSAANLNIHLHCLVLDGVYRTTDGVPVFQDVCGPTAEQLQGLLERIIKRIMRLLTRNGTLIEDQGMTYLAHTDSDTALATWVTGTEPTNPPVVILPVLRFEVIAPNETVDTNEGDIILWWENVPGLPAYRAIDPSF